MVKKMETRPYSMSLIVGKNEKRLIEGSAFYEGSAETSPTFHSKYAMANEAPNPLNFRVNALSYKLVRGILDTKFDNFNVYHGVNGKGDDFFLGFFQGGSKNTYDAIGITYDKAKGHPVVYSTNLYSHYLATMMLIRERYLSAQGRVDNKELDSVFRGFLQEDYVDANQKKAIYLLNDNLRAVFVRDIINKRHFHEVDFTDTDILSAKANALFNTKDIIADITDYRLSDVALEETKATKRKNTQEAGLHFGLNKTYPAKRPEKGEENAQTQMVNRDLKLKKQYWDGYKTFTEEEIAEMPLLLRNGYEMAHDAFLSNREFFTAQEWDLIDAIAQGDVRSINFNGPAGVGKTTTIRAMAGALGMPFVLVGGSANIEEADLLGTRNVEAKDGVSVTTWTDGPITSAIRYGAFLLFDEVNAADPGILMKLNTILDGSKSLILSTAEEVRVHPKFIYSEAMNVGAGYNGTDMLNQSHLDRCDEIFKITARRPDEEAKIISAVTGYTNLDNLKRVCETKAFIMSLIRSEGDDSEQICSPRRLICWVKKAKRTGEFIESSLSTVIAHLSVYDDSIQTLEVEEVLGSSGIAASVMNYIQEKFQDVTYAD